MTGTTDCPGDERLAAFVGRALPEEDRAELERHLATCAACSEAVTLAVQAFASDIGGSDDAQLRRGTVIGRYVVLDKIGAGAMGSVYRAYDPELDRRVAIKLVGARLQATGKSSLRTRLLREARAMATIDHANVITVHDVGTFGDEVFIAMELVDGSNLRGWLAGRERSVADVIDVFAAAGRGLAAAHAQGLVHRDFKPDNVLIGADGRVSVTDFGLVRRTVDATDLDDRGQVDEVAAWRVSTLSRTAAGAIVGTPAYMAPEQIAGRPTDPRSDQFGFCVALFEALTGERPFKGRTLAEVAVAIGAGAIATPTRLGKVPRRLRRAVVRGLADDPASRHRDMDALLRELRPSRRGVWGAAVITLPIAAIVAGGIAWTGPDTDLCDQVDRKIEGIWNTTRSEVVHTALVDTGRPSAEQAWSEVQARFDGYAASWTVLMRQECASGREGDDQPAAIALRSACLDRQLEAVGELVRVLEHADGKVVDRANAIAGQLPDVRECADAQRLATIAGMDAPTSAPEAIDSVNQAIARATAEYAAGHYDVALEAANSALSAAQALGHRSLEAEALFHAGRNVGLLGRHKEAAEILERAALAAIGARHHKVTARALAELVYVLGFRLSEPERGKEVAEWARAEIVALGGADDIEAALSMNLGAIAFGQYRFDEALEYQTRALELRDGPQQELDRASTLHNIAVVENQRGNLERAEALQREIVALRTRRLGAAHPATASAQLGLAQTLRHEGHVVDALAEARAALSTYEAVFPPEHILIEDCWTTLGNLLSDMNKWQESEDAYRKVVAIAQQRDGPQSFAAAKAWGNLSYALRFTAKAADAEVAARRSYELMDELLPADHPGRALAAHQLGYALADQERWDEAVELHERALEIQTRVYGDETAEVASTLLTFGRVLGAARRRRRAIEILERALRVYENIVRPAWERGEVEFLLAEQVDPTDPRRGCSLARTAMDRFISDETDHVARLQEIETWLAARPRCAKR